MLKKILDKYSRDGFLNTIISIARYPFTLQKRRARKRMLELPSVQERFAMIYRNHLWDSTESLSGEGSEIEYTQSIREWFSRNFSNYRIETFVDAPCGDFNWMRLVLKNIEVKYIGIDIVPSVIDKNVKLYTQPNVKFITGDICSDELPDCDLIMVRDCLFHLSFSDIDRFLNNLSRTNYQYLLTTNHIVAENFINYDIQTGQFRKIDLFSRPFNFNRSLVTEFIADSPNNHPIPRELILVKKQNVPTSLSRSESVIPSNAVGD